jgi:drug/metabolite transporter (DMT)-like permease
MGVSLAVFCAIAYSFNYIFIQLGMRKSPQDNGSFLSLFICVLTVMGIYGSMFLFGEKEMAPVSWIGVSFYMAAGFCTVFLGRTLLFAGIRKIGSSRAAALKNAAPVFTIIMAVLFLDETISLLAGIGILVILIFLFLQARLDFRRAKAHSEQKDRSGFMLALAAAICFGIGQGLRKLGIMYEADAVFGSLIGSVFALLVFILMEIGRKQLKLTLARNFKKINLYFVAAGIVTGLAQVSFFVSLLYTHVSYVSTIAAIEPIITIILARMLLASEERFDWRLIITACAVFLGTVIIIIGQ